MIRVIAGGKKNEAWVQAMFLEYEKRLKKPFDMKMECYEEEKLQKMLAEWRFSGREYVILLDERGENITSISLSEKLQRAFNRSLQVVIIIGGAYGVSEQARQRADFVWSLSKLVFPHQLVRAILIEQIYRAQEISHGGKYHHE